MTKQKLNRARKGHFGEAIAAMLLICKGYRIIHRRLRSPLGEVDLLARHGKTLVVVEVKWRAELETALYAVSKKQQARLQRVGEALFQQQAYEQQASEQKASEQEIDTLRFDVICIAPFKIKHIQNAF